MAGSGVEAVDKPEGLGRLRCGCGCACAEHLDALDYDIPALKAENARLVEKLATARALIEAQCGHIDAVNAAYEKGLAENAALRVRVERLEVPDIVMGEDSEVGFPMSDLGDLADDLQCDPGEVRQVRAYRTLPDRWLAHVVLTRDSDGFPDEAEPRLFDSEAEALAALAAAPGGDRE